MDLTADHVSNQANETPEVPRAFSSPGATNETSPSTAPPPYPTEDTPVQDEEPEEKPEAKSTISQATTAVASAAETTVDALKAKLAQAEAQIASLKETGLRQRNVKSAPVDDEKRAVAKMNQAVKQTVEGVPVQIAALLCLISFLLAYFFF